MYAWGVNAKLCCTQKRVELVGGEENDWWCMRIMKNQQTNARWHCSQNEEETTEIAEKGNFRPPTKPARTSHKKREALEALISHGSCFAQWISQLFPTRKMCCHSNEENHEWVNQSIKKINTFNINNNKSSALRNPINHISWWWKFLSYCFGKLVYSVEKGSSPPPTHPSIRQFSDDKKFSFKYWATCKKRAERHRMQIFPRPNTSQLCFMRCF